MKSTTMWVIVIFGAIIMFGGTANAWGGLFNRFSPEMLANMGYGNHGGGYHSYLENNEIGDDETAVEEDPCYNRPCTSNEGCCPGSVCFIVDGVHGHCLFVYGRKMGELCRRDADCEAGLTCESSYNGNRVCQAPMSIAKQYAEDCLSSVECDISRGLCCQLQRRHRQAARQVCSYFKDPLTCIGTVAMGQIKHEVQHTAGEKRITSGYKHNGLGIRK